MRWLVGFLLLLVSAMSVAQDKWRIGYYEGGPYEDYQQTLMSTLEGLKRRGLINYDAIPTQVSPEYTDELWTWMTQAIQSDHIEFVPDAYYSAGWDEDQRVVLANKVKTNVNLDLVIAMGTWAGKDLTDVGLSIPIVVHSSSDPISAGIVSAEEYSGREGVHATVHPHLYQTQVEVFHGVVRFERLGVFFQDDEAGRSYAHIEDIEIVAKTRGFDIVTCPTITDIPLERQKETEDSAVDCFAELAPKVDAIIITTQQGITNDSVRRMVELSIEHKVPTFDQEGHFTCHGVMMSLSQRNFEAVGYFNAGVIQEIMEGGHPELISQVFEQPAHIALNMETALRIGFNVPTYLVGTADELFYSIGACP